MKNIIIRNLNSEEQKIVEDVKSLTGEKTASKAVLQGCSEFILYKKRYQNLERRFFELVDKLEKLKAEKGK